MFSQLLQYFSVFSFFFLLIQINIKHAEMEMVFIIDNVIVTSTI